MPKRVTQEESDEYIRHKMRKIEKELRKYKKHSRRISSDTSSEPRENQESPGPSLLEDGQDSFSINESCLTPQNGELEDIEPISGPSKSIVPEEPQLDDEILEMLGTFPNKSKKVGDNIQRDIALRWEHITTSGLTKDVRKELIEKHLVPGNCPKLSAPALNLEIKAALSDTLVNKDKGTEFKQNQITSVISCIGEALTNIFKSEQKDPSIIKPLLDGAQLLCDLQFCESMKRRSLICSSIKKEIKGQLYETEIDTYLFGEGLADALKAAKAISKSGSDLKISRSKTTAVHHQPRALNLRPQLATSRQPTKRRQGPATYTQTPMIYPHPALPQQRQYMVPLAPLPPPPPPPPPPPQPRLPQPLSQPLPSQQRSKQRPYQRR